MLAPPNFDALHAFFGGAGGASVEYQLPAASNWCDLILLGEKDGQPSVLVIELKHWNTVNDTPGPVEGLMLRDRGLEHHPSRQVRGYTEYIRRFHSAVLERSAMVNGCVVFTRSGNASEYAKWPNDGLAANFPVFTMNTTDVSERFPRHAQSVLTAPSDEFAKEFEEGRYKQDRGFVRQIAEQIRNPRSAPFVLLDNQDKALLVCRERVRSLLDSKGQDRKHVIVVHGPPGSGKSVVAVNLWASIALDETLRQGDIVISTTSSSQNSNWVHLIAQETRLGGASGIVKKTNGYYPISTTELGRLRKRHGESFCRDQIAWRQNIDLVRNAKGFQSGAEDDAYLVSIVDEAHALINPEHPEGRGQFGFVSTLGPQAYHVIRGSRLTIFFMDRDQGFRDRENTTVADIAGWANELGATLQELDLGDAQFRCAGSKEYVAWIEGIRTNMDPRMAARRARHWRAPMEGQRVAEAPGASAYAPRGPMSLEFFDTPDDMEGYLRAKIASGLSARLLASYWTKWRTDGVAEPSTFPPEMQDFQIAYRDRLGRDRVWSRPWNFVPRGTGYELFVQATAGSAMASDPLCEVGCPYVVRGFDFDYIGILWGPDLVWRRNRWVVDVGHVHETGLTRLVGQARKEADVNGPRNVELQKRVWQAYRILLTRALRGVGLYVVDPETRDYLRIAAGA